MEPNLTMMYFSYYFLQIIGLVVFLGIIYKIVKFYRQ